jgi:hypothetical protein
MTGSGCASNVAEPLCLPARPVLYDITVEEQELINDDTLEKIAINDARLKSYIQTFERITREHNRQFKAQCAE